MFYDGLRRVPSGVAVDWSANEPARLRTIEGLLRVREAFDAADMWWRALEITGTAPPEVDPARPITRFRLPPRRTLTDTVLLATWNIREFATANKGGTRLPESYFYIAELLDRFDIVAVQEVRDDMGALNRVLSLLGSHWKVLVTDTNKESPGNGERMAILFDTRKVSHKGVAGEFVLPRSAASPQLARTPLVASFQVGWTSFMLAVVHILWGKSAADHPPKKEEIHQLARWLRKRTNDAAKAQAGGASSAEWANLILLGDFNIFSADTESMTELTKTGGFTIPPEIQGLPHTNLTGGRHYDQIAVRSSGDRFRLTGRAGGIDWATLVFRPEDAAAYAGDVKAGMKYDAWRSFQVSDHLILWVELAADHGTDYLHRRLADPAP
jgi:endonuclease/exonuclease/phosphatase family metal-dependent hydrolase